MPCLAYSSILKMEAAYLFKILVDFQQTALCYIPDDWPLDYHHYENFRSYRICLYWQESHILLIIILQFEVVCSVQVNSLWQDHTHLELFAELNIRLLIIVYTVGIPNNLYFQCFVTEPLHLLNTRTFKTIVTSELKLLYCTFKGNVWFL